MIVISPRSEVFEGRRWSDCPKQAFAMHLALEKAQLGAQLGLKGRHPGAVTGAGCVIQVELVRTVYMRRI
jgi:hypothetical protein